jgi:hypothetical protein
VAADFAAAEEDFAEEAADDSTTYNQIDHEQLKEEHNRSGSQHEPRDKAFAASKDPACGDSATGTADRMDISILNHFCPTRRHAFTGVFAETKGLC